LTWLTENPIELITFPLLVGGVSTCGLWCFGMVWLDHRLLPKSLQMKRPLLTATLLTATLLTATLLTATLLTATLLSEIGGKVFYDFVVSLV